MALKNIKKILTTSKEDIVSIILIVAITWIAWHGILNQIISGEGFIYFSSKYSFTIDSHLSDLAHNIDNFPRLLYFTLQKLYGGELQPFMNTMFAIIVLINLSIYWLIKKITNNLTIALLSAVFASANFISSYQFYARGHYQWFSQRVPQLLPTFLGIYFLNCFFQEGGKKYYLFSFLSFTLAMYMNYYATLSLPLYLGFIVVYTLFSKYWLKRLVKTVLLSLPFILVTYYLNSTAGLSLDTIRPNQTLLETIINNKDIFGKITFQLSVITFPLVIKEFIADLLKISLKNTIYLLIIPSILMYFFIFIVLLKKNFNLFKLAIVLFLATMGNLYLNVYLGRVNIYNEILQGRYYYNSAIYLGIIWACFFYIVLNQFLHKKILRIFFLGLIIITFVNINVKYIWKGIKDSQYEYTGGKKLLKVLNDRKNNLPTESIVFLPQPLMPLGEDFLKKYYSGKETKFLYIDTNWKSKVPENFDLNKLFVFDHNDEYKRGGKSDINRIETVDKSEQFRKDLGNQ